MEISKTLLGDSLYSPEDLKEAILLAYQRFKTWAEKFDSASLEQKKMIDCQLFNRIELGKDYKLTIYMNVTYKQFCSEWVKEHMELTA